MDTTASGKVGLLRDCVFGKEKINTTIIDQVSIWSNLKLENSTIICVCSLVLMKLGPPIRRDKLYPLFS